MDDNAPKIAKRMESAGVVLAVMFLLLGTLAEHRHWSIGVMQLVMGLFLLHRQVRVLTTQVDSAGVSQWTWRGHLRLKWADVTSVERDDRSVTLTAAAGNAIVPIESFYDSKEATGYLYSHLPARFQQ